MMHFLLHICYAIQIFAVSSHRETMAKRAGINKLATFHTSRHTFATMTMTAGADIYTTSKLLGHTSVHTTEIYADVVMEKKVDAVNLTDGLFG